MGTRISLEVRERAESQPKSNGLGDGKAVPDITQE
jgi:hypothetical protein